MSSGAAKPPYRVPSMAEIADLRKRASRTVVSTFSGCGGSCLGFEIAGFDVLWASEFIPEARETYEANHPGVPVDPRDVRLVQPEEILAAIGRERGDVDVLEGSPPCSPFSTAGRGAAGWGREVPYSGTTQRVDDLFFEFARIVEGVQPRVFVAENVAGLARGKAIGFFKLVHRALSAAGYRVSARVLDAARLGVPQVRRRLIFVGVREDLAVEPEHPRPLPFLYSIDEALQNLPEGAIVEPEASIERFAIGAEWKRLRPGEQSERYFSLVRPDPRRPCPTITQTAGAVASAAGVTHPLECRKFSLAELRRLCGFPDDFALPGSWSAGHERLGRAVPPPMMARVAETARCILDRCPS